MRTVRQLLDDKGRRVVAVAPEEPVLEAIQLMADHHIGAVLVMRGTELAGILSERDYARKVILKGRSSAETSAWEIMSSPVVTVGPNDTVNTCMRLMTERRIRHLPVVEEGQVSGVLSIGDLVKAVIEEQQQEIAQLQQYITAG
jgi:CBS domain-containing protein